MATYKINSTGNIIQAEQAYMDATYPGNYTLVTPDATPTQATKITRLAMMERIGFTAVSQLYSLQSSSAAAAAYIGELMAANFVDLTNPNTVAGLNELVTLGVLTSAQVTTILSAPIQQIEQP